MNQLDKSLLDFSKKKIKLEIIREIKSGKEATVFLVSWNDSLYALKVYKDNSHTSFNRYAVYREGKFIKHNSHRRALEKKTAFGRRLLEASRTDLEYQMLENLFLSGANVPQTFSFTDNSILMQYVGDFDIAAPKIKDVILSSEQTQELYERVLKNIEIFRENGIVHGDLSEFNILFWNDEIYIIDFPQAIDMRTNPNADDLYLRDLENIKKFFKKI